MRVLLSCITALVLGGCVTGVGNKPATSVDLGGSISKYIEEARNARERGLPVIIRGRCFSACAIKLASGRNLCVHPKALIGVHEVRKVPKGQTYRRSLRSEEGTHMFRSALPACVSQLFERRGGFSGSSITTATGGEILAACPQIKRCPD